MLRLPAQTIEDIKHLAQSLPNKGNARILMALSEPASKTLLSSQGRIVFAPNTKPQVFK